LQNLRFLQRGEKDGTGICGNLSYLRYLRAIEPLITHCQEQFSFTPLQTHGVEKFTA
jgi:hypothetical protein